MLDFPELCPLWDYERSFCSASICIPQHIYKEINRDTSTKVITGKRPVVLGAPRRKARGFLLCLDPSGKSKPVTTYRHLKHVPLPTPFNKEDRSLQAQGLTSSLEHNHHVASARSRAHTKSREAAGDRGERAGKASAAGRQEIQPYSPAIATRKRAEREAEG